MSKCAKCNKCAEEKPHTEFYKSTLNKGGETGTCKACHYAAMRANCLANPERTKALAKKHRDLMFERKRARRARMANDRPAAG